MLSQLGLIMTLVSSVMPVLANYQPIMATRKKTDISDKSKEVKRFVSSIFQTDYITYLSPYWSQSRTDLVLDIGRSKSNINNVHKKKHLLGLFPTD